MNERSSPRSGRRAALRRLAGAPLLPLAAPWAGLPWMSGCTPQRGSAQAPASPAAEVRFVGMPAPTLADPPAMATTSVGSSMLVRHADGRTQRWRLAYTPLFVTGDRVPDGRGGTLVAGGCYDHRMRPIVDRSLPGAERQFFSDCPDGSSLLTLPDAAVPGVTGRAVFAVVQFEYTSRDQRLESMYGRLPSPIAVLTLDQDVATGRLRLVQYRPVDTSPAHGLWITCGASLSPWNTHLSSEEYEPDATLVDNALLASFGANYFGDPTAANPYRYGHLPEVTVHPDGSGSVVKHYGVGRISRELVQVMPDERTLLMGDDWPNAGLFLYVADRPRRLDAGTLYVAIWHQTFGRGPGAGRLSWVRLGHATSAEVEALVAGGIRAADILDVRTSDPGDASFTRIPYAGRANWVRLRPGMEVAAAFLETHRYAALKGGSLGFTKMEGTTLNARDRIAYTAISRIERPMRDGSGGIRVEGPTSGAVYALNLRGGQRDDAGGDIASDWVPVDMAAVPALVGEDYGGAGQPRPDALGNLANPDRISMPDNLKFSERLRTLFIGEDSGAHVNNFLWAYQVDRGELTRLLSCPVGAESTGLHAVDDVNGWTYVMSNCQHVGDWDDALHARVRPALEPLVRANYRDGFGAAVGYLTGAPTVSTLAAADARGGEAPPSATAPAAPGSR